MGGDWTVSSLLIDLYRELPQAQQVDDPDMWNVRLRDSLRIFARKVKDHYTEGTLQRLLQNDSVMMRKAAVLALGLLGTFQSNAALAKRLHDDEENVAGMAADALWEIWFRGTQEHHKKELEQILNLPDYSQVLAGLDQLIRESPDFAEAYNQRAILYFQRGEFHRSVEDCKRVLELNPYHFGAQSGMGQCYLKMRMPKAAIRAFELSLKINPTLTYLHETIRSLRAAIGEADEDE